MPGVHHIFRWDLDKTYLKTEFDSVRELVRTARLTATERENIPGSAALIRAIRDLSPPEGQHQVYFISGSPEQMRSTIERKFALDGFVPDGFVLKPAVSQLLRGRFRAIKNQIPFKLKELLIGRSEAPIGTHETLFGDDRESDAFIYSLYADLVAGRVERPVLHQILERSGAYTDQIENIDQCLEDVVHETAVRRIIIHLDQRTAPLSFRRYFPRVVPIYTHLQTAWILALDGTLRAEAIPRVAGELLRDFAFEREALITQAEDIVLRQKRYYELEQIQSLVDRLPALAPAPSDDDTDAAREAISELLLAMNERLLPLLDPTSGRDAAPTATAPPDYLALFAAEQARLEEARRLRRARREGDD